VFTDETYIHQNHSPLMSWVKPDDKSVEKTTSKGNRLIVLHAITTDDFITLNDDEGFPIAEGAFEGENVVMTSKPTEGEVPPACCAGVVCANETNNNEMFST